MYMEKIRVYPNKEQQKLIDNILWECKCFYNHLLEMDREYYDLWKKSPTEGRLKFYEKIRKNFTFKSTPAQVQQQVSKRLQKSYDNFFNPKHSAYHRKIKFKNIHKFRSITYPQIKETGGSCRIIFDKNQIFFGKIGKIKTKFSRPLLGKPKTVTLKKIRAGEYYAFVTIDDSELSHWMPPAPEGSVVALDLGIEKFLVSSDTKMLSRPRFTNRHFRNKIKRAQRKLSRTKKGSKNRKRCREKLAKLHEHVANQRRDHHCKVAHWLCSQYETIIVEDLEVSSMLQKTKGRNKLFRKLLHSVALSEFLVILRHMCQKYHRQYIGVNPQNTSQICSGCGSLVPKQLEDRVHSCPQCGLQVDRDLNAAWNILSLGLTGKFNGVHGTVGTTETITLEKIVVPGIC